MARPDEELAPGDPAGRPDPDERDLEAPPEDAAEQAMSVSPEVEAAPVTSPSRSFEVGEWDAMEQSIVIDLEDDYDR
jgi:hypothetical protein